VSGLAWKNDVVGHDETTEAILSCYGLNRQRSYGSEVALEAYAARAAHSRKHSHRRDQTPMYRLANDADVLIVGWTRSLRIFKVLASPVEFPNPGEPRLLGRGDEWRTSPRRGAAH